MHSCSLYLYDSNNRSVDLIRSENAVLLDIVFVAIKYSKRRMIYLLRSTAIFMESESMAEKASWNSTVHLFVRCDRCGFIDVWLFGMPSNACHAALSNCIYFDYDNWDNLIVSCHWLFRSTTSTSRPPRLRTNHVSNVI